MLLGALPFNISGTCGAISTLERHADELSSSVLWPACLGWDTMSHRNHVLRAVATHVVAGEATEAATEVTTKDAALLARADAVLPTLTHLSTKSMPDGYSQFFSHGEGARVWDVDGKEYIDFMCSYGPISVGHRHPAVQDAIMAQMEKGDTLSGPSERMVELAEKLVELNDWSAFATFQKNGTDSTNLAVRYARAYTGKRKMLRAQGAYHGANALWVKGTPSSQGVLEEETAHQFSYHFNDLKSVEDAIESCDGDFACIMVSAFRWDFFHDLEWPTVEFLQGVRKLCDEHDAVLIMDDIRSTLRIDINGSWKQFGVNPDLMCQCKGIANGQALAAVIGCEKLRSAASKITSTGSFWASAVPFAAALATIDVLENGGIEQMERSGTMLREGLYAQAEKYGLSVTASGPVQMPLLIFEADRQGGMPSRDHSWDRVTMWASECAKAGVWFHPFHSNFLCAAHTEEVIADALEITDKAFAAVAAKFGKDEL